MSRRTQMFTVYVLIAALLITPTGRVVAQAGVVKVAFLGLAFEDVNVETQKKISQDLLSLIREERALLVLSPDELTDRLGEERMSRLLAQLQKNDLLDLAAQLDVEYIYTGKLSNQSRDPNRILLVGSLQRYDRVTRASYALDVLRYASDLSEDLKKFKQELVLTVIPTAASSSLWPALIIGGIAFIGILALLLTVAKTSGEERTSNEPVTN